MRRGPKEKIDMFKVRAELNFSAFFEYANPAKEISLFGVKINNLTIKSAAAMIDSYIKTGKPHFIATPNPEIIMTAQNDRALKKIINSADLCIPDGMGVLAASKILGMPLIERVTGIDLMMEVLKGAKENGYRVFLLGSSYGVAESAANNLPGINIEGTHHGYFDDTNEKEVLEQIKHSRRDILFVGLGAPRQEFWAAKHYQDLGVPVTMVIGGSLDAISGRVKRAPVVFQKLGIEWLYRLAKEPKRWKRQLKLVEFMLMVVKRRLILK
jgi:N-acetylglucosaminyldiphosphoundecaprenol N-acetyl-beta-D-mannosaminyltransferase